MVACVALLRAVNVGGRGGIAMADLRAVAEGIGLSAVRTLLQSGNLIFETPDPEGVEARLETQLAEACGIKTEVLVRDAGAWTALVAGNPFPEAAADDPGHLVAMPLREAPAAAAVARLEKAIKGRERVAAAGRELYLHYLDGIGRSKLTGAVIEKHLGTRGTGRNWNTVLKIAAALGSGPAAG